MYLKKASLVLTMMTSLLVGCGDGDSDTNPLPDGSEKTLAKYWVNPTDLSLSFQSGDYENDDVEVWQEIIKVLPNDVLQKQIVEYVVFTDGDYKTLAYVAVSPQDTNKLTFAIDSSDVKNFTSFGFVTTIVHEFGHVISLDDRQLDKNVSVCYNYLMDQGCTKDNSYLNQFFLRFWQGALYQEHQYTLQGLTGEDMYLAVDDFYEKHNRRFVNAYAATNPEEDFAETFMNFVLSDRIDHPVNEKQQKINFFYDYPKLVNIRNQIRRNTKVRKF